MLQHHQTNQRLRTAHVCAAAIESPLVVEGDFRQRAADGPATFLLVSPQSDPETGEHPEAERRLRAALSTLRAEGIEAHGQVAHPDPYTAAMQVVDDEKVDEIIISTFPGERSGWLRRDVVERLRKDAGVPVEHVVGTVPAEVAS